MDKGTYVSNNNEIIIGTKKREERLEAMGKREEMSVRNKRKQANKTIDSEDGYREKERAGLNEKRDERAKISMNSEGAVISHAIEVNSAASVREETGAVAGDLKEEKTEIKINCKNLTRVHSV
ncbi:hypothetical protein BgiMline_033133 [Biomphalaria glabrata]